MKITFRLLLIAMFFAVVGLHAQSPTYPVPYNLGDADYSLNTWDPATPALTYPSNMVFHYTNFADPFADKESYTDYERAYNLTGGTRITGLNAEGFQFTNSGSGSFPNKLGDAVLGLNTTGRTNIKVSWIGKTTASAVSSYRIYKLSLQYRIGTTNAWTTIGPEYSSVLAAISAANSATWDVQSIQNVQLPAILEDLPNVQLRWMYSYVSGSGTRPNMAIDDISVTSLSASGVPTKLAVASISPIKVLNGLPFAITVNTVGADNARKNVFTPTQIRISKINGNGTLTPIANLNKNN